MRLLAFLITLLVTMPTQVRANDPYVEDDALTKLPKEVADAIYAAEGKNLIDARHPKGGRCNLIGRRISLVPGAKSAYFATTADACNWGAAIGPIWLVLDAPHPVVVLSYGGQGLHLEKEMRNGFPNITVAAATAGWSQKSWWQFDGAKYVKYKSELCTPSPGEDTDLTCKTSLNQ